MLKVTCGLCEQAVDVGEVGEHLSAVHVGRPNWHCRSKCNFQNEIAQHCLLTGHPVGEVTRADADVHFLQLLAAIQNEQPLEAKREETPQQKMETPVKRPCPDASDDCGFIQSEEKDGKHGMTLSLDDGRQSSASSSTHKYCVKCEQSVNTSSGLGGLVGHVYRSKHPLWSHSDLNMWQCLLCHQDFRLPERVRSHLKMSHSLLKLGEVRGRMGVRVGGGLLDEIVASFPDEDNLRHALTRYFAPYTQIPTESPLAP